MVGRYPTNYLIRRGPLRQRNSFALRPYTVSAAVSRGCPVLPGRFPRVTHPCATPWRTRAFDLHVLGMPPAFVLSQDQTLMFIPSPGSHPGKVTRKSGPSHIWSHHRQRDAPHARQTHAQTPMPQHQGQTPRPAARASLPLPIHSVKQPTPVHTRQRTPRGSKNPRKLSNRLERRDPAYTPGGVGASTIFLLADAPACRRVDRSNGKQILACPGPA